MQTAREIRGTSRRADLAFKSAKDGLRAGFATHNVRVNAGVVELTPKQLDRVGTPVRFETRDIQREGLTLFAPARSARLVNTTEVHFDRGAITEQIENREEGVEQRWAFAEKPGGEGDLLVSVGVAGHANVESSASGLHFFTTGGLGFRYSTARWFDAAGNGWDLRPTWEAGRIVIRVPQSIVETSTYPVLLDPTVEAESAVDELVVGNVGGGAISPHIASRPGSAFAIWADGRADSRNPDIYGTRLTGDGSVVDFRGILINGAAGIQATPVVGRTDATWVAAWRSANTDIVAARIDDSGVVTQLGTIGAGQLPAIAGAGSTAVLAFQSGTGDISAAVFNGTSFGGAFSVAATATTEVDPAVATSGAGFLVAWSDDAGVQGQLLDANGAIAGAPFTIAAGGAFHVAASFNGTDYVVAFNLGSEIFGVRVGTTGTVVDTTPVQITNAPGLQSESSVACDGAGCVIVYSDARDIATTGFDIFATRVNPDLTGGVETAVQTAGRYQLVPAVANATSGFLAVWEDQRTGGSALVIETSISSAGAVTDAVGRVVSTSYAHEQDAAVSTSASQQLVVWSDSRALGNDILGLRYNGVGGGGLDNPPKVLSNAANEQSTPAVSHDGTNFVAVWSDARGATRDIYATRFDASGATLDGAGIAVTSAAGEQFLPDIASGGGVSLAVWMDRRNGHFDIFGAIIAANGTVTAADIPIATALNDQDSPAVAFDPTNNVFVVVWSDKNSSTVADIVGARVSPAGAVLDAGGVILSAGGGGAGTPFAQLSPDIAFSKDKFMVVWDDRKSDPVGDIIGTRVSAAGNALTPLDLGGIPISYAMPDRQNSPTIVGVPNDRWMVAWTDHRNFATNGSDIYGVELSALGQPADTVGIAIAADAGNQGGAAFQSDPNTLTTVAIVYHHYRADLLTTRVFRRLISFTEPGGNAGTVCSVDAQCSTGFCVDGYCCDSACGGSLNFTDCQTCSVAYGATANGVCSVVSIPTICRVSQTNECDLHEYCDGVNASCPPDIGRREGQSCTTAGGGAGTCPEEDAPGPHTCQ